MSKRRLNVHDAAEALGISVDAVRMRARRGSLESEHEKGRLYVWLGNDETTAGKGATEPTRNTTERELIDELREQVAFLRSQLDQEREENRRKDHLLVAALERIPRIEAPPQQDEAPSEPRESRVTASEGEEKGETPGRSSWWRKLLFG